ncbi:MAG: GFA family protein [Kiloniellales bacterium]|nr:GFA family protein [Kiloniellales bacterium]
MSERAVRASGACLCGGVRFEVHGPLRDVIVCHCGQCRRTHGHAAAYTSATRDDVVFHEQSTLKWYASSDQARRGFCGACGASLFWEPQGEGRLAIAAGCLDTPTGLKTERHVYVRDASDYYEIPDDLPHHSGGSRA